MFGEKLRNTRGGNKKPLVSKRKNAYSLTVNGSLTVVNYLLNNTVKGGTYTPAKLMGYEASDRVTGFWSAGH